MKIMKLLINLLHPTSCQLFLGPNIILNNLFSNTLSLRSSLKVKNQVSHSYKITGKLQFWKFKLLCFLEKIEKTKHSQINLFFS
jgi:hypothetical protein